MNPTELDMFSAAEQTLLVQTERDRLAEMSEDELDAVVHGVFAELAPSTPSCTDASRPTWWASKSSRAGTSTSNQRTKRKAEILEDARTSGRLHSAPLRAPPPGNSKRSVWRLPRRRRVRPAHRGEPKGPPRASTAQKSGRQAPTRSFDLEGPPGVPQVVRRTQSGQTRPPAQSQTSPSLDVVVQLVVLDLELADPGLDDVADRDDSGPVSHRRRRLGGGGSGVRSSCP